MATAAEAPDFRNARWAMTRTEVIAVEDEAELRPLSSMNGLAGTVTIVGHSTFVYYMFSNGCLNEGVYIFQTPHTNKNLYIDDYRQLQTLLTSIYGAPVRESTSWHKDLFRNDPSNWGLAISCGDLVLTSVWETPRTTITLMLSGDNYELMHSLSYESRVTPTAAPDLRGL